MDFREAAIELHNNNIVIDAHLDLAGEIYNRNLAGEKDIIKNYYLKDFQKAGFNIIVSSLYIDSIFLPEMLKMLIVIMRIIGRLKPYLYKPRKLTLR